MEHLIKLLGMNFRRVLSSMTKIMTIIIELYMNNYKSATFFVLSHYLFFRNILQKSTFSIDFLYFPKIINKSI